MDTWDRIVGLRRELLEQLERAPAELWDAPTLCPGWRVRDVVAHTILPERMFGLGSLGSLVRARFSLGTMLHQDAVRRGSAPVPELIESFRAGIERRTLPPGRTAEHLLDDLFIHAQDVRRPHGLSWSYPPELLASVASALAVDRALGVPRRITGLTLLATDVDWSVGAGQEVVGPAEAIILAMSGRSAVLPELSGAGLSTLSTRISNT